MAELVKTFILDVFGNLFGVLVLSLVPIVELRGAIPVGAAMGYEWWQVLLVSVVGNLIPVPFIVFFIRKILNWLKKCGPFKKLAEKIEKRGTEKAASIKTGIKVGLFLFVAIPLPGTGAWTGALIASMLDMKLKDCFLPISLGVVSAGVIMTIVSYGVKIFAGIF